MSDATVQLACKGDEKAFAHLVEENYRMVYGLAFSAVGDWSAAEDIAQETFLVAWRNLSGLRSPGAFGAWLRKIARNLASGWLRTAGYRRSLAKRQRELRERTPENADTPCNLEASEQRREIWDAIQTLSPKLREAVVLFYLEDHSIAEAARALDTTENTIKKRLQHARPKLRAYFEARWQAEMERERKRLNPQDASQKFLTGLALGPVDAVLGKTAASSGLSFLTHALRHGELGALTRGKHLALVKLSLAAGGCALLAGVATLLVLGGGSPPKAVPSTQPTGIALAVSGTLRREATPVSAISNVAGLRLPPERGEEDAGVVMAATAQTEPQTTHPENLPEPRKIASPADYARLTGRVTDKAENPIPGAKITVIAVGVERLGGGGYGGASAARSPAAIRAAGEQGRRFIEAIDRAMFDQTRHTTATSGRDGTFVVTGIAYEGVAVTRVAAEGYETLGGNFLVRAGSNSEHNYVLSPGVTLKGGVLSASGTLVTDAKLQATAFSTPRIASSKMPSDWDWTYVDRQARFALTVQGHGLVTVQVVSPTHGKATFADVVVASDSFVELKFPHRATVHGRIQWQDGAPAKECVVRLDGAAVQTRRIVGGGASGGAVAFGDSFRATVDESGAYRIEGLDPGLTYAATILDASGAAVAGRVLLGEVPSGQGLEWNYTIETPILLRGTLRCAFTGKPLSGIQMRCGKPTVSGTGHGQVEKTSTDPDGNYAFRLVFGPGSYHVRSEYERFGLGYYPNPESEYAVTTELSAGETREMDFVFPEPWRRVFRVVTPEGKPVPGCLLSLQERWRDGRPQTWTWPETTDTDGRVRVTGLAPGAGIKGAFSRGHLKGTSVAHIGQPGEELPEETVVVYAQAGLAGVLVDETGAALANAAFELVTRYGDAGEQTLTGATDAHGAFEFRDELPATSFVATFVIKENMENETLLLSYTSDPIECVANHIVDLGTVVLGEDGM